MRRQSPVKGGRDQLPSCVVREVKRKVEQEAKRFGCSKLFVVAVALAEFFEIKVERYDR